MTAYYNELDPYAAQWLRNLIAGGHIAPGDVDERSIADVRPDELTRYTQCHFFAGIGVWSYAARIAGWPDERPLWTGSCPCQPFSAAGKGAGFDDPRHLWPVWQRLIAECRPDVVLGEQVEGKDGGAWLDLVWSDMENMGYAFGPHVSPSAGFGAPHIRHRIRFAASLEYAAGDGREQRRAGADGRGAPGGCSVGELADADDEGFQGWREPGRECSGERVAGASVMAGELADAERPGSTNGFWRDADWLGCLDGRFRPVEPGSFPLAHGAAARVGRLRAYGNAVDAQATAHFVAAVIETLGCIPDAIGKA